MAVLDSYDVGAARGNSPSGIPGSGYQIPKGTPGRIRVSYCNGVASADTGHRAERSNPSTLGDQLGVDKRRGVWYTRVKAKLEGREGGIALLNKVHEVRIWSQALQL